MPKVLDWQADWPPISLACKHANMDVLKECLTKNDVLKSELSQLSAEALRERAIADITERAPKPEEGKEPEPVDFTPLDEAQASDNPVQATVELLLKVHKNDPNTPNSRGCADLRNTLVTFAVASCLAFPVVRRQFDC
jgi:hypothetical protein